MYCFVRFVAFLPQEIRTPLLVVSEVKIIYTMSFSPELSFIDWHSLLRLFYPLILSYSRKYMAPIMYIMAI